MLFFLLGYFLWLFSTATATGERKHLVPADAGVKLWVSTLAACYKSSGELFQNADARGLLPSALSWSGTRPRHQHFLKTLLEHIARTESLAKVSS